MSPTSLVPGASAWKSRASRSGITPGSPATGGGGPERARLAGDQAQLAHDRADQFRGEALALAVQGGMDPAVPVGVLKIHSMRVARRARRRAVAEVGRSRHS